MTDAAAILAELRALRAAVEALRRERDTLTPGQRAVLEAVARLYGPAEPFTTAALADVARFDPEARTALQRACGAEPQRLGILLRQISDSGATVDGLRLVRLPAEAGVRRWALEGGESL